MKVSFKLNLQQLARARAQVLKTERRDSASDELDSRDNYEGNLVGWAEDHGFSYNRNQRLDLVGDTLVFQGERCPFHQDGMFKLLTLILTGEEKPAKGWEEEFVPLEYQTSDARLEWWETLASYLYERGTIEDLETHLRTPRTRWGDVTIVPILTKAISGSPEMLAAVRAVAAARHGNRGNEATLRAAFDPATLKVAALVVDHTNKSYF